MTDRERARELWSALGLEKESHTLVIMQALAAVRAETVEQAAKINEEWMKADALLLACGEMSAQEIRTAKAVLAARAAAIRSITTGDTNV